MRFLTRLLLTCLVSGSLYAPVQAATFKNPPLIPTAYDPRGVVTGDFNQDGYLDLVYLDGTNPQAIHVLLGNGNGKFSHAQDVNLPAAICGFLSRCFITVADVTADGNDDLILGGRDGFMAQVATLRGNGDGTFQTSVVSAFQPAASAYPLLAFAIAVGDMNEDGAMDLAVPDSLNDQLYLLLGDNTGSFTFGGTIFTATRSALYLADLNADGHLDMVSMDLLGAGFVVLLGNGNGSFQTGVRYSTGGPTSGLFLADIDSDGHPDAVAQVYPGQIVVLKGNPDGTFASPFSVTNAPANDTFAAVEDCNDDGIQDLVFLIPTGLGLVLGQGNLTYGSLIPTVSGSSNSAAIALGDFNEDSHTDIAMGVGGGIAILEGDGLGSFASADFYDMGQQVGAAAIANFSSDSYPDIAVTLPAAFPRLLLGTGLGNFDLGPDPNASYGSQSPGTKMTVADFNGDGKKDLAVVGTSPSFPYGGTVVLFGTGNGTFSSPTAPLAGLTVVADVNNDGRSDMVFSSGLSLTSLLGQADGSFTTVTTTLRNGASTQGLGVGDLNNDGKLDVLIYYSVHPDVWLGNGDGSFTYQQSLTIPSEPSVINRVVVADLDSDGNSDLVFTPYPYPPAPWLPIAIFYGNGDGSFEQPVYLPTSHRFLDLLIVDVNADNRPDLVLNEGTGVAVIVNLGARTFGPEEHYVAGAVSSLSAADVNGDGFPDIVAANGSGTTVAVLLNEPNGMPLGAAINGTFSVTPEPSDYAQPITLALSVSASGSGSPVPTGSVSFSVDGAFIATVPLTSGAAVDTLGTSLAAGTHTFLASYNGDAIYRPASFARLHFVEPPVYVTQTVLAADPVAVLTSQTVRLTATVTSSPPVPGGIVTFSEGTTTLGAQMVDANGVALLDTALLAQGMHTITALYQGSTFRNSERWEVFAPSTSAPVAVTVTSTPTTTALSASTAMPTAGTVVTFTADVASGGEMPFGGVTFYDASTPLGTMSLRVDGSASFATASLETGVHNITAVFNSNATFASSVSSVVPVTVVAPPSTVNATRVSLAVQDNATKDTSALLAEVGSLGGLPVGTVTFLNRGEILGSVATNGTGTAKLAIPRLTGGTYSLSASFSGSAQFAPSVSPELYEQWPSTGPGFSLNVNTNRLKVNSTGSEPLRIYLTPMPGFGQKIRLSCEGGLPGGYSCVFSPALLEGGGTSYLFIHRTYSTNATRGLYVRGLSEVAMGVAFLFLSVGARGRRHIPSAIILFVCLSLGMLAGCAQPKPAANEASQMTVLTIRATSSAGATQIVHSAQVALEVPLTNSGPEAFGTAPSD